jgi:hypothetical protein
MVSSKKKKAENRRARARASEIFGRTLPSPQAPSSSPTMSSSRREPSPPRRPYSAPKGPRAEEGYHFKGRDSSSDVRQHRDRSRSRSPGRRPSIITRYDSYNPGRRDNSEYRAEVERRSKENYRPIYDDPTARPLPKDTRRKY